MWRLLMRYDGSQTFRCVCFREMGDDGFRFIPVQASLDMYARSP